MRNKPAIYSLMTLCLWFGCSGLKAQSYDIDYVKADSNLYIYTSYYDMGEWKKIGANGLIIEGDKEVIVVDAPWDSVQTVQLLGWIADSLQKPVAALIITHAHEDRIGGIAQAHAANIPTIATRLTGEEAATNGFESPGYLFDRDTLISIPGAMAEVYYPGAGHTRDNCVVYLADSQTLYGGCFLKSASSKNLGNIADADIEAWPESLDNTESRFPKAELVIPGHGSREAGAIKNTRKLLGAHLASDSEEQ